MKWRQVKLHWVNRTSRDVKGFRGRGVLLLTDRTHSSSETPRSGHVLFMMSAWLINNWSHPGMHKHAAHPPSSIGRSAAIQNVFILRVIASDWTVKYHHLLSVPWKISTKAIGRIDRCASRCLLEGWEGQWLWYYSRWGRSGVRGFNFEEAK